VSLQLLRQLQHLLRLLTQYYVELQCTVSSREVDDMEHFILGQGVLQQLRERVLGALQVRTWVAGLQELIEHFLHL
jgi:hypothetical protein